jgi:hypothetical protein
MIMLCRVRLITSMSVYKFAKSWWCAASNWTQNCESNKWQSEHDMHVPACWSQLVQQNLARHYSTAERCILPTRHDSLWLLMFPKLNTLKCKRHDDMGTVEHIDVEQLLMIQETWLERCFHHRQKWNICMYWRTLLWRKLSSHPCKYSIVRFIDCLIFFIQASYFTYHVRFAVGSSGKKNFVLMVLHVKVKGKVILVQSMEAFRIARGWGSHIFRHSAHRWWRGC